LLDKTDERPSLLALFTLLADLWWFATITGLAGCGFGRAAADQRFRERGQVRREDDGQPVRRRLARYPTAWRLPDDWRVE